MGSERYLVRAGRGSVDEIINNSYTFCSLMFATKRFLKQNIAAFVAGILYFVGFGFEGQ